MAGFEDLIRKAIANHADTGGGTGPDGRAGPEQREAIYASSRAALERMLAQNEALDGEARQLQRDRLNAAIERIEADHPPEPVAPALPPSVPHPMPPSLSRPERLEPEVPSADVPPVQPPVQPPVHSSAQSPLTGEEEPPAGDTLRETLDANPAMQQPVAAQSSGIGFIQPQQSSPDETGFSASRDPQPDGSQPFVAAPAAPVGPVGPSGESADTVDMEGFSAQRAEPVERYETPPDYDGRALRKRRPYANMLAWIIILTGLGVAGWWLYTFGTGLLTDRADGSVPNPQQVTELGPFRPDTDTAEGDGPWLTIFDPARDAGNIVTGTRGTAEVLTQDGRQIVRLTSADNTDNGTILIRIPRGIAEEIAGKAATFEVAARGADGNGQQIGIFCEFDALGTCGRKRFEVDEGQVSHIFDVLTEDASLPAGREAYLGFSTDLTDGERGLEISGIRVRTGS